MSGSNAIDGNSDFYLYLSASNYWKGSGRLGTDYVYTNNFLPQSNATWSWNNSNSQNNVFTWSATKKGDFIICDGTNMSSTVNDGFFQIQDSTSTAQFSLGNKFIRGTNTFTAEKTADTVEMIGVNATDYYLLQWKGATVPTAPLTYTTMVDSLVVYCAEADTALARASGYIWLRFE